MMHNTQANSEEEGVRVAKVIASRSIHSRRDAESLIESRRVTVGGSLVLHPSLKIAPTDPTLAIDGVLLSAVEAPEIWLFHKPAGVVTTARDPQGRPTIYSLLPEAFRGRMTVGRLDIQSEGLLLLTNHAPIKQYLEHPQHALARRYRVRIYQETATSPLSLASKMEQLRAGMTVEGITYQPVEAEIESLDRAGRNTWLQLTLHEGKNREIRRLCTALDLRVNRLIRAAYGPFSLDGLQKAGWKVASSAALNAVLRHIKESA